MIQHDSLVLCLATSSWEMSTSGLGMVQVAIVKPRLQKGPQLIVKPRVQQCPQLKETTAQVARLLRNHAI